MRHLIPKVLLTLAVLTGLTLGGLVPSVWSAKSVNLSTDYTGTPPYLSDVVAPNILMLMDNSVSMRARANCDPAICTPLVDGTVDNTGEQSDVFVPATSYAGYFDSLRCYTYANKKSNDTADISNRFTDGGGKTPTQVVGICSPTQWDGNLLNWITFRRIDAIKKAMTGGECLNGARNDVANDGTCPVGPDGKITIQSHRGGGLIAEQMQISTTAGVGDQITGRVPTDYRYAPATALAIHLRGSGVYTGWFCVNDNYDGLYGWYDQTQACDAGVVVTCAMCGHEVRGAVAAWTEPAHSVWVCDLFAEVACIAGHFDQVPDTIHAALPGVDYYYDITAYQAGADATAAGFNIRLASDTQPKGVIQQVGNQARLGLMVFQPNPDPNQPNIETDGGVVTVGIGARQSTVHVDERTTNAAAMIDGIDAIYSQSATPLAESLYEAARYIAQLPPSRGAVVSPSLGFDDGSYSYPFAFAGAAKFGKTGVGSIGKGEVSALIKGEKCPAGYLDDACGRDPYFFGQNYSPAWASPSAVFPCCRTFVILVTDGSPTRDENVPNALKNYATGVHGTHCSWACATNPNTSASTLLLQHKTDYPGGSHYLDDVALWAHTTDLRQATIPGINEAGHDLPGKTQNLTLYAVYAFGNISGREVLMQAARQGGYEYDPEKPKSLSNLATRNCTNSDGSLGKSSPEWDKLNNATGTSTPDCIPDNYFESSNSDEIRDRLFAAINRIVEVTTSGASVSLMASSSIGEGVTYQSFFYQSKNEIVGGSAKHLTWLGFLQGFFVDNFGNLREDTVGDGTLILKEDHIIKLRYEASPGFGAPRTVADIYEDTMGTGAGDKPLGTIELTELKPIWEGGRRLALTDPADRTILTWIDLNNNGLVDSGEQIPFVTASTGAICPYLGGASVSECRSGGAGGAGQTEAANIISFIRGVQDPAAKLRDRERTVTDDLGNSVLKVWKLGDIMAATPVQVGAPHERYDVIYGDADYSKFFRLYKDRRQVVYAGANDGMLHAFNSGFLSTGVDSKYEHIRLTETPLQPGSKNPCGATMACGAVVGGVPLRSGPPQRGAELWAFVPQDLLPQLRWLTSPSYSHIYYVDLKPKASDVRIFCDTTNAKSSPNCITGQTTPHPGGWGTILIAGFRFGGSCSNCTQGKGEARTVTAEFGSGGSSTRVFLSSYFVLDVTNPELDPVLLWTFRDQDLGLTTAAPSVVRANRLGDPKTSAMNEKWHVVLGTGMTHYDGSSGQTAQVFVVDLLGPSYLTTNGTVNQTSGTIRGKACSVASPCLAADTSVGATVGRFSTVEKGFMADAAGLDGDLDFRVDAIYIGNVLCNGSTPSPCDGSNPDWGGTMWRLTTNGGSENLATWGVSGQTAADPRELSVLISMFDCTTKKGKGCNGTQVGPIGAAPALSIDEAQNFWVFFGTGRLITGLDKRNTDSQGFFGVKDNCAISSVCTDQTTERNDLLDVTDISVCTDCDPAKNVSKNQGSTFYTGFTGGKTSLVGSIQTKDGWVTTLTGGERSLSTAALLGGTLFFSTFAPNESPCEFSGGGRLYGLYYLTGTGYPIASLGAAVNTLGNNMAVTKIRIDSGMPSQVALHIGAQGSGAAGESSTSGCSSRITANIGTTTSAISQPCVKPALNPWSRMLSWRDL